MVNQKKSFNVSFFGISPGWVYDEENQRMISSGEAPTTISSLELDDLASVNEQSLRNLSGEKNEHIWKKDFENADEKHCFLFRFTGTYSKSLNSLECAPEGTVTEVNYQKCIRMLVCSTEKSSYAECLQYLKKVSVGREAELCAKTTESCKKCFIYNSNSQRQSFTSLMSCFKEYIRIFNEIKSLTNFDVFSWKFIGQCGNSGVCDVNYSISCSSDVTPEKPTKNYDIHHECSEAVLVHKNKSFKKKMKMDEVKHSIKTNLVSNPPQKVIDKELKSTDVARNGFGVKKLQQSQSDTILKTTILISISQTCEGETNDSTHVPLSCSNGSEVTNLKKTEDYPGSSDGNAASNYLEHFHSDTDLFESDDKKISVVSAVTLNNDGHATFGLNGNLESLSLHNKALKDMKQNKFITNVHKPSICSSIESTNVEKFSEDSKMEEICENFLIVKDVSKVDGSNFKRNSEILPAEGTQFELDEAETNGPGTLDPCEPSINSSEERGFIEQTINYGEREIMLTISEFSGVRKEEIGNRHNKKKGKVLILLGSTGSGKSAIVNLCANYYFGAKIADEEKLFIVDSKYKTDRVTVYTFYPEGENDFPITVVDTPGLNDSTGAEIHDHVDALRSFLALACSQGLEINALCFVAQAHLVRLTSSEKLVMDYVKSLFGSDVEKHIMALVTFSDNQPTPPVIEAMGQYGFTSPFFVKFNNTLLISKTEAVDELDRVYWRTGLRSWKKCLKHLSTMDSLSNAAISSIKDEVLVKSVFRKHMTNLHSEIRALIIMCNNKQDLKDIFTDKELRLKRTKLWRTSNVAYNALGNRFEDGREVFLIKETQQCLSKGSKFPLVDLALFLLLDNESSLRSALVALASSFFKVYNMLSTLNPIMEVKSNSVLSAYCTVCQLNCSFKRMVKKNSFQGQMRFECQCPCSGNSHFPSQKGAIVPPMTNLWINFLNTTVQSIKTEKSKYSGKCQFDINLILFALEINESENCKRDCSLLRSVLSKYSMDLKIK